MAIDQRPTVLGDLLRCYRERRGLSQEELAQRAVPPLSPETVSNLERGRTRPYRHTVQAVCRALELDEAARAGVWAARDALVPRRAPVVPAGSGNQASGNLPLSASRLIGRERELEELTRRVRDQDTRLLTLVGTGGVGKTRLAIEAARGLVTIYPNGVSLIELAPMTDPALVTQRVATELGVRETPGEPLASTLIRALRPRRTLVVLDNCEHLLDACAELLTQVLRACPQVRVLATSREPIGIDGEVVWRVPSLPLPDPRLVATPRELENNPCVRLFVDRARAVQRRFVLTPNNAPAVVQICRRLDGIPLAVELAAARVDSVTADQIALRLDQRFRLLTGGRRSALPRQQTLVATLDWSYDLLSEPERRLFESLAVFSGGWTLEAAEAVCADQGLCAEDVLDLLAGLTRKSLVAAEETADGAARYALPETIRAYARQKLLNRGQAQLASLRQCHADFYSTLAKRLDPRQTAPQRRLMWGNWFESVLGTTPPAEQLGQVQVEYDNIRLALDWWLETDQPDAGLRLARVVDGFWMWRGLYSEGRSWIETLLEADQQCMPAIGAVGVSQALRAGALHALGLYASRQGDYQQAQECLEASIAQTREFGDDVMVAATLSTLGLVLWLGGRPDRASALLDESQRILDQSGGGGDETHGWTAMTLRNLGLVARSRGNYARAADLFGQSVTLVQSFGVGGYALARGLGHLGRAEFLRGERAQAIVHLGEALRVMGQDGIAGHSLADCLDWVAALAGDQAHSAPAARLFGAAAAQWLASGAVRYAPDRPAYDRDLASVRAQLDNHAFTAAWAEGEAMTAEEAIAFALHEVDRG